MVSTKTKAKATGASASGSVQRAMLGGKAPRTFVGGKAPRVAPVDAAAAAESAAAVLASAGMELDSEEAGAELGATPVVVPAAPKKKASAGAKRGVGSEAAVVAERDGAAALSEMRSADPDAVATPKKKKVPATKAVKTTGVGLAKIRENINAVSGAGAAGAVVKRKRKRYSDPSAGVRREAKRLQESPNSMLRRRPFQRMVRAIAAKQSSSGNAVRIRPEFIDVVLEGTEALLTLLFKSATEIANSRRVKTIKPNDWYVAERILRIWGVKAVMRLPDSDLLQTDPDSDLPQTGAVGASRRRAESAQAGGKRRNRTLSGPADVRGSEPDAEIGWEAGVPRHSATDLIEVVPQTQAGATNDNDDDYDLGDF
jgi:histone H3/H4